MKPPFSSAIDLQLWIIHEGNMFPSQHESKRATMRVLRTGDPIPNKRTFKNASLLPPTYYCAIKTRIIPGFGRSYRRLNRKMDSLNTSIKMYILHPLFEKSVWYFCVMNVGNIVFMWYLSSQIPFFGRLLMCQAMKVKKTEVSANARAMLLHYRIRKN